MCMYYKRTALFDSGAVCAVSHTLEVKQMSPDGKINHNNINTQNKRLQRLFEMKHFGFFKRLNTKILSDLKVTITKKESKSNENKKK